MEHPLEGVNDPVNAWRLQTPGTTSGWAGSAWPGAANKYFMFSADSHLAEPPTLWMERVDVKYRDRLPRLHVDDVGGAKVAVQEGFRPSKISLGEEAGPQDRYREKAGSAETRWLDQSYDGVDFELVFPNKGMLSFSTRDPEFSLAMCRVYNDWVFEKLKPDAHRSLPLAAIPAVDVKLAIGEVERTAAMGFRGLLLPVKPAFGPEHYEDPNYNLPEYDPLWEVIEATGLPMTFHVGSGRDPRIARKHGGAVINMVWGSHAPSMHTVLNLCTSGMLDRYPKLRFAIIEAGTGWVPWLIEYMDHAYVRHHMWVKPKLKHGLPSEYFKAHGYATFEEDTSGTMLVEELGLEENFLWGNDYPHSEGTWPHSAQAIERKMGHLAESTRKKLLGLNAAKLFGVPVPAEQR